jgi:hypothetical protein
MSSEQNNADKMVLGILVALPPFFFCVGTQLFKQKSVSASRPDVDVLNHNALVMLALSLSMFQSFLLACEF